MNLGSAAHMKVSISYVQQEVGHSPRESINRGGHKGNNPKQQFNIQAPRHRTVIGNRAGTETAWRRNPSAGVPQAIVSLTSVDDRLSLS